MNYLNLKTCFTLLFLGFAFSSGAMAEKAHSPDEVLASEGAAIEGHDKNVEEKNNNEEYSKEEEAPEEEAVASEEFPVFEVTVTGKRLINAASDQTVRNKDFMNFPRKTASDLLRFIPGLHVTQHTGGAKAHQIFLRGFDAEHGQDVAAFLDGVPLNEPSQVHGMGYLDLHFIIPEAIKKIWVTNGPYDPRYGNFAAAGVIDYIPYVERDYNYGLALGGGSDHFVEGMAEYYRKWSGMDSYIIAEYDRTEGFTEPGKAQAGRGFFHHRIPIGEASELRFMYAGYAARTEAADILPKEWIDKNYISPFAAIDDSNGVDADRHLAAITIDWRKHNLNGRAQAYYNYKRTLIFSNYTFYFFNPQKGDQLEQFDLRHYGGANAYITWFAKAGEIDFITEGGLNLRSDWVEQTQANTIRRERFNIINHYEFNESSFGAYLFEQINLTAWARIILGARFDISLYSGEGTQDRYGEFNIYTNRPDFLDDDPASLETYAYAVSPKASLIFQPLEEWRIFLNFGRGFSTAAARQLAWEEDKTIPAIMAAELGNMLDIWSSRLSLALSGWWAEKEADSVFDSEFGTSIPRGKSRRFGGDFEARINLMNWLYIGSDLFYVNARFVEEYQPIPNTPEWMMTNLVSAIHPKGFRGSIRGRLLGPRKHDLGFTSGAYYLVDAQVGYEIAPIAVTLSVENLFNTKWHDSVFAYSSRPQRGGEEVKGLHVTAGTPTSARIRIEAHF